MKQKIIAFLNWFTKIWVILVILSIFVGIIGILIYDDWFKLLEIFNPFNVINYLVIIALLLPAVGAFWVSDYLSKSNQK